MQYLCKQCQRPIRVRVGCRPREYCNNACKQLAYRFNREEKKRNHIRQQWQGYSSDSRDCLEKLLRLYGEEAAQLALNAIHHL